jgi:protein transport protein SEC24
MRSTLYSVPTTDDILSSSNIPFGLIVQPLADLDPEEAPMPVVDSRQSGPARCSRCAAYVNPFFRFVEGGRKSVCNICQHWSDVSPDYFSNLDMNGRRLDIAQRPELMFGSCEFEVQNEYCARDPQPCNYLFAVDVSWNSVQSGMLATFASSIKHYLYSGNFTIPPGSRFGFLTYDRAIQFYNMHVT